MKEIELLKKEQELRDWKRTLDEREKMVNRREFFAWGDAPKEQPLTKEQEKLIAEGCKAYGIAKKDLFHSRIDKDTGEAILVTKGGKKIRYRKSGKASYKLTPVELTGEIPEGKRTWSKRFSQWLRVDEIFN
jgi:hypothetical protein